jgi:S-adenosylmethionine decarboxylase proenzyme
MSRGAHLLIECLDCERAPLDDAVALERALARAADAIGARVVSTAFHRFAPQGVTGVLLLEESHISIHTWPELGYAAVDLYTCGAADPELAVAVLAAALGPKRLEILRIRRGSLDARKAISVLD